VIPVIAIAPCSSTGRWRWRWAPAVVVAVALSAGGGGGPAYHRGVSVRPIRLFGDPVLTQRAAPVVDFDRELRTLVRDLTDTMQAAPGRGLAAPQVGVGLRVFVYDVDEVVGHLVNPEVRVVGAEEQDGDEGCLSIPGLAFPCVRARQVVASGWSMYGEPVTIDGSDLLARAIQHEVDHLDGVLFVDRLDDETRDRALEAIRTAEWFDGVDPTVKVSPHRTRGLPV
jgi:peptide deformylase